MKTPRVEKLRRRAVKAGLRTSKKVHHGLSREEILALRVQVLPAAPRIALFAIGIACLSCAIAAWPSGDALIRVIEGFAGLLFLLFGFFGVRKTLAEIGDGLGNGAIDAIVEGVSSAVSALGDGFDI